MLNVIDRCICKSRKLDKLIFENVVVSLNNIYLISLDLWTDNYLKLWQYLSVLNLGAKYLFIFLLVTRSLSLKLYKIKTSDPSRIKSGITCYTLLIGRNISSVWVRCIFLDLKMCSAQVEKTWISFQKSRVSWKGNIFCLL